MFPNSIRRDSLSWLTGSKQKAEYRFLSMEE